MNRATLGPWVNRASYPPPARGFLRTISAKSLRLALKYKAAVKTGSTVGFDWLDDKPAVSFKQPRQGASQ